MITDPKKPTAQLYPAALLAGAVGGISPNLLRVIIALNAQPPQKITDAWGGYILALALLAAMGAFVVWVWQEKIPRKAFYLGVGLPALIQVGTLQSPKTASNSEPWPSFSLVATAHAAPVAGTGTGSGRRFWVTSRASDDFAVVFYDAQKGELSSRTIQASQPQAMEVPDRASAFAIRVGASVSSTKELPGAANAMLAVGVEVTARKGSGFLQALGVERPGGVDIKVSVEQITLSPAERTQFIGLMREVQSMLRAGGFFQPAPDGVFGPTTLNAIRAYQASKGLVVDQNLGGVTLSGLIGERAKELIRLARMIETALKAQGFQPGANEGHFSPMTQAAIVAFQVKHGLNTDGLGLDTLKVLFDGTK